MAEAYYENLFKIFKNKFYSPNFPSSHAITIKENIIESLSNTFDISTAIMQ